MTCPHLAMLARESVNQENCGYEDDTYCEEQIITVPRVRFVAHGNAAWIIPRPLSWFIRWGTTYDEYRRQPRTD